MQEAKVVAAVADAAADVDKAAATETNWKH